MKKVIALIGRISSGKDYAGDFLAEKFGIPHLGISSSLRMLARERGISEKREHLIEIGKEVTKKYGDGYLAEVLVMKELSDVFIISGPRQVGPLEYLRKNTHCIIIGIEADTKIRYERMLKRGKIAENISFERFLEVEKMEEGGVQDVGKCFKLCDSIIENNGNLKDFEEEILQIAQEFLAKGNGEK